jgi:hypothetical protein
LCVHVTHHSIWPVEGSSAAASSMGKWPESIEPTNRLPAHSFILRPAFRGSRELSCPCGPCRRCTFRQAVPPVALTKVQCGHMSPRMCLIIAPGRAARGGRKLQGSRLAWGVAAAGWLA